MTDRGKGLRVSKVSFPNAVDSRSSLNSQHHDAGAATMYSHSSPRHDFARTRNGRAVQLLLAYGRTYGRHACIPHAGFARLSLARLSLINLFGRTIVRNPTGNPIGWKGPTMYRTGGCIAIKGEQPSCPRELVLCVFRLSHLISPPTNRRHFVCAEQKRKTKERTRKECSDELIKKKSKPTMAAVRNSHY